MLTTTARAVSIGIAILAGSTMLTPRAYAISASELLEVCRSDRPYDRGRCDGYIQAIAEQGDGFCLPAGVYIEQITPPVLAEISFDPGDVHATIAVRNALRTQWPC